MDRVYDSGLACTLCGRVPSINFIYSCQVDTDPSYGGLKTVSLKHGHNVQDRSLSPPASNGSKRRKIQKTVNRESWNDKRPDQLERMEQLGFNSSVIDAAKAGHYSSDQISRLIQQKLHVKACIGEALGDNEILRSKNGPQAQMLADKLTAAAASSADGEGSMSEKGTANKLQKRPSNKTRQRSSSKAMSKCNFTVCHTCRPFSRDRSFASFEAAFNDEVKLPSMYIPQLMPVQSVEIVRQLGTRPSPPKPERLHGVTDDPETLESDLELSETSSNSEPDSAKADLGIPSKHPIRQFARMTLDGHASVDTQRRSKEDTTLQHGQQLLDHNALVQKASTEGFNQCLIRDMHQLLVQAYRDAASSSTGCDLRTGLTAEILSKLMALYAKRHGRVFDYQLWHALQTAVIAEAARTPLPPADEDEVRYISDANGYPTLQKWVARSVADMRSEYADRGSVMMRGGATADESYASDKSSASRSRSDSDVEMSRLEHADGPELTEEAAENHCPDMVIASI